MIARPADPRIAKNGAGHRLPPRSDAGARVETLVDLLRLRASDQPDHLGYSFIGADDSAPVQLTYRALDRQARAIGAYLSAVVPPGDRALLLMPHGPDYIAAFFGCLYANVIAVPAFPPSTRRVDGRVAAIAADASASVVLATERTLRALTRSVEQYPALRGLRWVAVESLLADGDTVWEPAGSGRSALAYLQYTSGSTSTPRGVMIAHANALHNLGAIRQGVAGRPQSHVVSWAPLFHDLGLVGGVLTPLYLGIPLTAMSPLHFLEDPLRWLRVISALRASASPAPNFAYDLCVQRSTPAERASLDLSSWNFACIAAEPIRPATLERFAAAFADAGFRPEAFWPAFGLAEATLAVTIGVFPGQRLSRPFDRSALERGEAVPRAVGESGDVRVLATGGRWPRDGEAAIADPDSGILLPPGRIGEIWFKSDSVGRGYWNRPAESEVTFQARLADSGAGPFLRTGDLGFVHDDELFVTGRLKDLIVIRGRNHYPQDFEHSAESSHPEVRRTCVAAVRVERDGEEQFIVVAEVRRRSWPEPGVLAEIADSIRIALTADHQVEPSAVALVGPATLPKTSSGKLRRGLIREIWLNGGFTALYTWERLSERSATVSPSLTLTEQVRNGHILPALLDCVGQALGSRTLPLSGHDRVLDLGLDSLRLVHLKLVIEQRIGHSLPFTHLADNPTLQDLAARLHEGPNDAPQPLDLWAEATLDLDIRPPARRASLAAGTQKMLLTGATGFLGAYLLRELIDQTEAQVCCLVRADDEQAARERLQRTLAIYGLWNERDAARICPVPGDLSQPLLGLGADRFAALASDVDTIYHNGAWLNFVHPYQRLKSANVDGTREVLRLACHGSAKAVHYVSTAGVFYGAAYDGRSIDEAEPLDHPDGLDLGYAQTKWVAEQLVWEAARRGLAVSVYRPGWILGGSRTAHANGDDFFGRLVRGCVQLGLAPRLGYRWRGTPVDDVARVIVTLATGSGATGRAFNLSGPNAVAWERLVAWITEAGYPLDLVAYDEWLANLSRNADNPLLPLLPFFAERAPGQQKTLVERYAERDLAHVDDTDTRGALPVGVADCRPLDRELLHRYLGSYTASGLLPTLGA